LDVYDVNSDIFLAKSCFKSVSFGVNMTIFTSKQTDKKEDSDIPSPEVVSDSEYKLLVESEKKPDAPPVVVVRPPAQPITVAVSAGRGRRNPLLKLWASLLALVLLLLVAFICLMVYKVVSAHQANNNQGNYSIEAAEQVYSSRCGVHFHDNGHMIDDDGAEMMPLNGDFEQGVTIDDASHERIEVPVIGDMRRSTVLHDFNQNVTAIIDRDQQYCFLLPLNRSLVMPPRDFWDLLMKLKTGYYIPDVDIIRENYRALTPPVADVSVYGYNIWRECNAFSTYKLVRDGEPVAMAKRSAPFCEFAGEQFCLGDAGASKMLCIGIKGCI
jgi:hypothetical protein